ncbi:unnamed protein product [Ambrosiozyma monospora]|uniref:Unnamed protein product n=1 Tax=Ambrosiozyma monospora TaxID=43982 RepID=A0ACB5T009_AMBMO|nr:unnamed protein product [Ambrosiozyma monospora]
MEMPQTSTASSSSGSGSGSNSVPNVRMQDYNHQKRFERFLDFRGVKRQQVRGTLFDNSKTDSRIQSLLSSVHNDNDSETATAGQRGNGLDEGDDDDNYEPIMGDILLVDDDESDTLSSDGETNNPLQEYLSREDSEADSDLFYSNTASAFQVISPVPESAPNSARSSKPNSVIFGPNDNSTHTIYVSSDDDLKKSSSTVWDFTPIKDKSHNIPINSNDMFANFENREDHDPMGMVEDYPISERVEYPFETQPAAKFKDSLELNYKYSKKLRLDLGRKYKNNLCVCSSKYNLLIIGSISTLYLYDIAALELPESHAPTIEFDTRPPRTTNEHLTNSTMPYYPHTINYMKLGIFRDKETLVVAVDDGRILVYDIERIVDEASKFKENTERSRYDIFCVEPDHCMKGYSSVWGIDIYKNMIAIADNCQMVKLFCFQDDVVISVQTHQVLHNIPSISFIPTQSENAYYISVVSISGELLIFKFPFTKSKVAPERLVMFNKPVVINRALFNDNVWTTCTVDASNFKSVNSIQTMIGDPWLDMQNDLCNKILSESCILDAESDECHSSHLGLAAELQNCHGYVSSDQETIR